jgi:hypothetical protein
MATHSPSFATPQTIPSHAVIGGSHAHPGSCHAEGDGLWSAMARRAAHFTIVALDARGRRRREGGEPFVVSIRGPGAVTTSVRDCQDGTYSVGWVVRAPSSHHASPLTSPVCPHSLCPRSHVHAHTPSHHVEQGTLGRRLCRHRYCHHLHFPTHTVATATRAPLAPPPPPPPPPAAAAACAGQRFWCLLDCRLPSR